MSGTPRRARRKSYIGAYVPNEWVNLCACGRLAGADVHLEVVLTVFCNGFLLCQSCIAAKAVR